MSTTDKPIHIDATEATEDAAGNPEGLAEAGTVAAHAPHAPETRPKPWLDLLGAIGLWLLSVLALVIVPNVLVLPYILYRYWGAENIMQLVAADQTAIFLSVLGVVPAHIVTFAAAWALVTQWGRRPFWRSLNWSLGRSFGFWASAGLALLLYMAGAIIAWKVGKGATTDIETLILNSTLATRITLALLATFTGPLVEEIVYRGVIYTAMEKTMGTVWAVILVSFLFTLVHVFQYRNNVGVILVVGILSVTLTLVRAMTGRLLACFIIHMIFNGVQSILIIFHPYMEQFEKFLEKKVGVVLMFEHALPLFWHGL